MNEQEPPTSSAGGVSSPNSTPPRRLRFPSPVFGAIIGALFFTTLIATVALSSWVSVLSDTAARKAAGVSGILAFDGREVPHGWRKLVPAFGGSVEVDPLARGPVAYTRVFSVTNTTTTKLEYSAGADYAIAICVNQTPSVGVYVVDPNAANTSQGTGPYCQNCAGGPVFPTGTASVRTASGTASLSCTFYSTPLASAIGVGGCCGGNGGDGGPGGDFIYVNGTPTGDTDFNDTTPTAPAGSLNAVWQIFGSGPTQASVSVNANDLLDIISNTPGSVLYRGDTEWLALGPGPDGYVLTAHGPDAGPTWEPGGGSVDGGPGNFVPIDAQGSKVTQVNYSAGWLAYDGADAGVSNYVTDLFPGWTYAGTDDPSSYAQAGSMWVDDLSCWEDYCYSEWSLAGLFTYGPSMPGQLLGLPLNGSARLALGSMSDESHSLIDVTSMLTIGRSTTSDTGAWVKLTSRAAEVYANALMQRPYMFLSGRPSGSSARATGIVTAYDVIASSAITSYTPGVAGVSNPYLTLSSYSGFTTVGGDAFIVIAGSDANDGFYEAYSVGPPLLLRGVGTTPTTEPWSFDQVVASPASDGGIAYQVRVSVARAGTDGAWEVGSGATTPITFRDIATSTSTATQIPYTSGPNQFAGTDQLVWATVSGGALSLGKRAATGYYLIDALLDSDRTNVPLMRLEHHNVNTDYVAPGVLFSERLTSGTSSHQNVRIETLPQGVNINSAFALSSVVNGGNIYGSNPWGISGGAFAGYFLSSETGPGSKVGAVGFAYDTNASFTTPKIGLSGIAYGVAGQTIGVYGTASWHPFDINSMIGVYATLYGYNAAPPITEGALVADNATWSTRPIARFRENGSDKWVWQSGSLNSWQATSGTAPYSQLPTLSVAGSPSMPACSELAHFGRMVTVDDTSDGDDAKVCVCLRDSGGSWAWRRVDDNATAC